MSTTHDSRAETIFGVTAVTTAGGVLSYALFPLALPGLVLVGILAIPLLPLAIVGGLVYAIVALVRRAWRLARQAGGRSRTVKASSARGPRRTTISTAVPSRRSA